MGWDLLQTSLPCALAVLLVLCGVQDARSREISNAKNIAVALLAPAWWVAIGLDPWPGMATQLAVAFAVFALFCGAFYLGQMGGGDVKLIGALALWLPPTPLLRMLVAMALAGGVVTLLILAEHRLRRAEGAPEVPYGVAIAVAGLLALREPLLNQFP